MDNKTSIEKAKQHFAAILEQQLARVQQMKKDSAWTDYSVLKPIIIGICWGDGIGRMISKHAERVLKSVLTQEVEKGLVEFRDIQGLTIENRSACGKAIPEDVLAELKKCHVILKGPTTTPQAGDGWPNIESANVAMRRELDLFANVRPVKIPQEGVDWTFFRENTEGLYIGEETWLDKDTVVAVKRVTRAGSERIARFAFEYARANNRSSVTAVHKANILKESDGLFLNIAREISSSYPEVSFHDRIVDALCMDLVIDPGRHDVLLCPNLYGDIISDLAAGLVGGLGAVPGANLGGQCAIFEAVHGSAPDIASQGIANPTALILAGTMLLSHLGETEAADRIETAVRSVYAAGKNLTPDMGGTASTRSFTTAVIQQLS